MLKNLTLALLLGCLFAGYAVADPAMTGNPMTPEKMAQHWQQNTARCLLLGDQEQVLLGEFAAERAQNPEVKQFAQAMVKNHSGCITKLEQFAPGSLTTEELKKRAYAIQMEVKSEKATTPVSSDTDESVRATMSMAGKQPMQMVASMQQEMAENCLALTQAELAKVDAEQFDKAYMSQQVFSHIATLAKLRTMESYVSPALKPIIEAEETAVRAHLEEAKKICKQLDTKTVSQTMGSSGND
jgi:predicted outer membrane protein